MQTEYDGLGSTTKLTAYNGSSASAQETVYLYEDSVDASRLTSEIYPDSTDTTSSGSDQIKFAYHVDGTRQTRTDQRGTVITYSYDDLRRTQANQVTSLGGDTDGAVRSITTGYDPLGRVSKITSHGNQTDDPDNTSDVANQIVLTYDDLGNVTESEQSHSGVVGGSTPSVQYTYDMSATSGLLDNRARLEQLTYPDGRTLFYDYGSSDGIDDLLSRPYRLRESNGSGTILVEYSRTGGGQTVVTDYQQPDLKLDLFQGTSGTYAGLDRFGRTIDHLWDGYNSTADAVQLKYGYDYAGSRTWREDLIAANNSQKYDELYTYDGLDRLTGLARGEINGTYTVISSDTFGQDWELEQLGNWSNFLEDSDGNGSDDLDQDRSHNEANEITDIDASSANVGHDATGNMTTVPQPGSWSSNYTLTWDAWNRLVKVADGGATVAEYGYDGKNRRIVKQVYSGGLLDETQHHYLSLQNQVLEVRLDSDTDAHKQFTWGSRYIDDLVLRERDTTGNGILDERLYALQDANWNITALSDTSGTITERFHYDPYGKSTVLESDFTLDGDGVSDKDWEFRYTSREFDAETGLQYFRARYYHSGLGRFCSRDPIGYINGRSLYGNYFLIVGADPFGYGWFGGVIGGFGGGMGGVVGGTVVGAIVGTIAVGVVILTAPVSVPAGMVITGVAVTGGVLGGLGGSYLGAHEGDDLEDQKASWETTFVETFETGLETGATIGSGGIIRTLAPFDDGPPEPPTSSGPPVETGNPYQSPNCQ